MLRNMYIKEIQDRLKRHPACTRHDIHVWSHGRREYKRRPLKPMEGEMLRPGPAQPRLPGRPFFDLLLQLLFDDDDDDDDDDEGWGASG